VSFFTQDDSRTSSVTVNSGYTEVIAGAHGPSTAGSTGMAFGVSYKTLTATNTENPPAWSTNRADSWVANTLLFDELFTFTISATLKDSSGTALADGIKVMAFDSTAFTAANAFDRLIVRAADVLANGDGTITLTVYSGGDKIIMVDPADEANMSGETLITHPITPV
jgi:hypothetical protein